MVASLVLIGLRKRARREERAESREFVDGIDRNYRTWHKVNAALRFPNPDNRLFPVKRLGRGLK